MNKKTGIIIGVVAVIVILILGGMVLLNNTDITLEGTGAYVTVPSDYELDTNSGTATKDDIIITFNGIIGSTQSTVDFYKALNANGKSAGYEKVTNDTINDFKVYEYSANMTGLKTLKYGSSTEWVEYQPEEIVDNAGSKISGDHYRKVYFITPNNSAANELTIVAKNANTDLYSEEINDIIHSIELTSE